MRRDPLAKLRRKPHEKLMARLPTTRTCEDCDLCCTAVGVTELGKEPGEPCKHLCGEPGKSCSIYRRRPKDCAEFVCLWRASDTLLPERMRPAEAGFVVTLNDPMTFPLVVCVHPDPDQPKAWDTPDNVAAFLQLADAWNCVVAVGQSHTAHVVFTPKGERYSKDSHPRFFTAKGAGAPGFCFHDDTRPPVYRIADAHRAWTTPE